MFAFGPTFTSTTPALPSAWRVDAVHDCARNVQAERRAFRLLDCESLSGVFSGNTARQRSNVGMGTKKRHEHFNYFLDAGIATFATANVR